MKKILISSAVANFPGFKDLFGFDARIMNYLAEKLSELFQLWGYERISLSLIEDINSFSERIVGGSPWPEWNQKGSFFLKIDDYKNSYNELPDSTSALLIPEGTISVSRWLANQIGNNFNDVNNFYPLKVFYITPCFRNELTKKLSQNKGRCFTQAGIEIIGASNCLADLENIVLIAEGIKILGASSKKIMVRLGDVRIFNGLCKESGISIEDSYILKEFFDALAESRAGKDKECLCQEKDNINKILSKYNINTSLKEKWMFCMSGWHQQISLATANSLGYADSISDLNYLAKQLKLLGIPCVIDLAVIRSHEYYTSIVYEVDVSFRGKTIIEIAGGGRYNKLIGRFLNEKLIIPAVGFAFGLERMCGLFAVKKKKFTSNIHHWLDSKSADVVIRALPEKFPKAVDEASRLRNKFLRVDIFVGDNLSKDAVRCYTKAKDIKSKVFL